MGAIQSTEPVLTIRTPGMTSAEFRALPGPEESGLVALDAKALNALAAAFARLGGDAASQTFEMVLRSIGDRVLTYADYPSLVAALGAKLAPQKRDLLDAVAKSILAKSHIQRLILERDSCLRILDVLENGMSLCLELMQSQNALRDIGVERAADALVQECSRLEHSVDEDDPLRELLNDMALRVFDVQKQLRSAAVMRDRLVPRSQNFDVGLFTLSVSHCAQARKLEDWWTIRKLRDGRSLIFLGELDGHVSETILAASMAKAAIDAMSMGSPSGLTAQRVLDVLNATIYSLSRGTFSMSCVAAVVDPTSQTVSFASAGDLAPYLVRPLQEGNQLYSIFERGPALGRESSPTYSCKTVTLLRGDVLVWNSHGLVECLNSNGEQFGAKRLREALAGIDTNSSSVAIRDHLLTAISQFSGNDRLLQDQTLLVAHIDFCS